LVQVHDGYGNLGMNMVTVIKTAANTVDTRWTEGTEKPKPWENPFSDVKTGDWFYGDVEYVVKNGLFDGTSPTTFSPRMDLTRGMVVTVLHRLAGSPGVAGLTNPFDDVDEDIWYSDAVKWGASNKIVLGYGDGTFRPGKPVSRQELAALLIRYADFAKISIAATREYPGFKDEAAIADYAKDVIKRCYQAGIIIGKTGDIFDPKGNATRAEFAAMLHRMLEPVK